MGVLFFGNYCLQNVPKYGSCGVSGSLAYMSQRNGVEGKAVSGEGNGLGQP